MELKNGYKQTEIGIIPDDWNVQRLKYLVEGNRIPSGIYKDKKLYGHGNKIIKLGDVFNHDLFFPDLAQRVTLSNEELVNFRVKIGDIFIALASVKLEGVGKVMLVNNLVEDTVYDHNVALIRLYNEVNKKYICYLFKSNVVRNLVSSKATQVGTTFLKASTILEFPLPLPPTKTEQTAIANALSDADAWIQSLTRLITKKRQIKQGAIQTLLNPYKNGHLKTGWVAKKLGDIGMFLKGSGVKKDEACTGSLPCIRYGEIYTKHCDYIKQFASYISNDIAATATRIKKGDVLFAGSGETKEDIGKCVAFIDEFEAYAGGDIVILRQREMCPKFLGFYLNTSTINCQKASKGQGDAVVHISATILANIDIIVPADIKEQSHITTILSSMDNEIITLEIKLTKAQQIKQGMMQNLLTGRIRLI